VIAVLVALPACSSDAPNSGPSATAGTAAPNTTTANPYAIPVVIDVGYVGRVLDGLDALKGDVTRLIVTSKTIPREAFDRLQAMYTSDDLLDREITSYSKDLADGLSAYRPNPGNKKSTVRELITKTPQCLYVRVDRDYSAVGVNGTTGRAEWIALRPLDRSRDPHNYNQTGWAYLYEGFTQQRTQPAQNPCVA